ncbi:hypothetical protein [Massilia niabensis]|uniref:Uncharacterized protein n=1 Tax=Massilia niabensis TaxID=544910 RepID=A0ABW0L814_9BURK
MLTLNGGHSNRRLPQETRSARNCFICRKDNILVHWVSGCLLLPVTGCHPFTVIESRMSKPSSSNKTVPLRSLVLLLSVFVAQNGWACRVAPRQQLISVDEQIMAATDVSVAEVISAIPVEGRDIEYRFLVRQRLAGEDRGVFTVMGRGKQGKHWSDFSTGSGAAGDDRDTSFDHHTNPVFWKRGGGRVMNEGDCGIYPSFVVGATYLVFLGSPVTWRSFEKIEVVNGRISDDDKWLAYVKAGLARRRDAETPIPAQLF